MRVRVVVWALVASFLASGGGASRILGVFPYPSPSHMTVFSALTKELARRGHELVVVSPYPLAKQMANYTDVDTMPAVAGVHDAVFNKDIYDLAGFPLILILTSFWEEGLLVTEETLKLDQVKQILKDERGFDLVIAEAFIEEAIYAYSHHFNAPLVLISSMNGMHWTNYAVGNPTLWSHYPNPMLTYTDKMDFTERVTNFLFTLVWDLGNYFYYYPQQNELKEKYFGPGSPDLRQIERSASLVLVNAHFSLTFPRPLVPAMVEVGGMHVATTNQKLPEDMQQFLDGATDGAVYFSMGSNLRSDFMSPEKIQHVLTAFSKLPQRVLWKWESDDLPNKPKNVKIGKWMPQQDILAHKNVRAFITHGGLLSAQEAAFHGVALIGIPIYGDQMLNIKQAERAGYAVVLNYQNLTEESMTWAVKKAVYDQSIQDEAQRRARVVRDQPQSPLERAVFWTEYVIRHKGAPHLQSAAVDLQWYQVELLDVYLFVAGVTIFSATFVYYLILKVCGRKSKTKTE